MGVEVITSGEHWRTSDEEAMNRLLNLREGISEGQLWVIRNRLFSDGQTVELGDAFRTFVTGISDPPESATKKTELSGWRSEESDLQKFKGTRRGMDAVGCQR
jgi:hypothetical protein